MLKCHTMVFIRNVVPLKKIPWLQWIAGIAALLMMFTLSLMVGWTSPYLAKLTAKDSPLLITKEEGSWVASLFNFGRLIGAVVGGFSVHFFGTKRTLIIIGFPVMLGFICIIVANSVIWLYAARISSGISLGMAFSSFPIFLGEVSSPMIRGSMVSLAMNGLALGTLVGNTMGAYISMTLFSYIGLVPNIAFILLFLWLPHSPHYLVRIGKMDDAEKSMARYNPNVDPKIELESLKNFHTVSESLTFQDRLKELNISRNRKAGFITLMLLFFVQFSGLNSLVFYQEIVLNAAMFNVIPPAQLVMIASTVGVVSGWVAIYIADKFQRKVLMIFGSAGIAIAMGALGTHFALLDYGFDPETLQWLPITIILLFTFSVCSGVVNVPNMILSEIFAPNIKSLAVSIASITVGLFSFVAAGTFQPLVTIIGEKYLFWAHAILMVVCIIFSAVYVPKTKGKSLQEIQDALMHK